MQNLSRKQLNRRAIGLGCACIVLLLIFISLIAVGIPLLKGKSRFASNSTFHIKNHTEFLTALKHNSESKDKTLSYCIDEKIVLSINELPNDIDFYGNLNGQGNTIIIKTNNESVTMDKPIFNTIHSNAVVERLNIIIEGVQLSAEDKENISLLSTTNNGIIKNCSIEIENIEIGGCPNTAALVNFNCGKIFNICLTVNNVKSTINNANSWYSVFGTVATINYANIKNVLLDITFDDNLFVFQGQYINNKVGYVTGGITENGSIEDIYVFVKSDDNFKYLSKACDNQNLRYDSKMYTDIDSALQSEIQDKFNNSKGNKIIESNSFNNYWSWKDTTGKFPVLA